MNSTRHSNRIWGTAALLAVAIAGGVACTAETTGEEPEIAGVKYQLVPGPTVTVTPSPLLSPDAPLPSQEPAPAPDVVKKPSRPARRATAAQYTLSISCNEMSRRQDGRSVSGITIGTPHAVRAGHTQRYEFSYQRQESDNPVVEQTRRCTTKTTKMREGAEPRLGILLSCEGEATYTANPRATSTDAGSWRPSELLSGHTHVMTAPKSPEQLSEHVRCTVWVVSL